MYRNVSECICLYLNVIAFIRLCFRFKNGFLLCFEVEISSDVSECIRMYPNMLGDFRCELGLNWFRPLDEEF